MKSAQFPVVGGGISGAEAARRATKDGVSAVLVESGDGLRLVDVRLSIAPGETIGALAAKRGIPIKGQTGLATVSNAPAVTRVGAGRADISISDDLLALFAAPAGYKECSADPDHILCPKLPRQPLSDG